MFSEEALPKGKGEYILGYYSNNCSSLAGVTEPFQVSHCPAERRGLGKSSGGGCGGDAGCQAGGKECMCTVQEGEFYRWGRGNWAGSDWVNIILWKECDAFCGVGELHGG